MSARAEAELWDMLSDAQQMPYGGAQVAAVEEIIRHADAQSLQQVQYAARILAIRAYNYGAEPAKSFVMFSWCLAAYDRGEADTRFNHTLYWYFKWMVSHMTKFPEVPLERTYAVLDEMERRYRLAGHTMNPVHQHRWMVAHHIGDAAGAEEQYRLWSAAPRGGMSDCVGCEPTSKVSHLQQCGRDEEAVALAVQVLGGKLSCEEQPQAILTELLLPYLRTGRLDEAADAHRRAYRAIQTDRSETSSVAEHIVFCARSGNEARGLELVERHLGWLEAAPHPYAEMNLAAAAALLLRRITESGRGDLPVRRGGAETPAAALADELAVRALGVAERFDTRNGTSHQGDQVRQTLAAEPIADSLPLSRHARRMASRPPAPPEPPAARPAAIEALPDTPEELAALAELQERQHDLPAAAATWRRFDQVCPEPPPALLARRLTGRGAELAQDQPPEAEKAWTQAAELYGEIGDSGEQQATLARLGLLKCLNGQVEDGLAVVTASAEQIFAGDDPARRARAGLRLGNAYRVAGRLDDGLAALRRAEESASQADNPLLSADVALRTAQLTTDAGDRVAALTYLEQAYQGYRAAAAPVAAARAALMAGQLQAAAGDFDAARASLAEARDTTEPQVRAFTRQVLGRIQLQLGSPDEAVDTLTEAVAEFAAAGMPEVAAHSMVDLAVAHLQREEPMEAAEAAEEAVPVFDRQGDRNQADRARYLLAGAYRQLGQHDQAIGLLDHVAAHCAEHVNPAREGQMHAEAAEILDQLDRDAQAAERFTRAADAYQAATLPIDELVQRRRAALSWQWAGEQERALAAITVADTAARRAPADEPQAVWERAMLNHDAARIFANAERLEEALERAVKASAGLRSLGAAVEAAVADTMRGRLLLSLDRRDEAGQVLASALEQLPAEAAGPRKQVEELLAELRG